MPKSAKSTPNSGAISLNDIHIEASGGSSSGVSGTTCSFNISTDWDIFSGFQPVAVGNVSSGTFANMNTKHGCPDLPMERLEKRISLSFPRILGQHMQE